MSYNKTEDQAAQQRTRTIAELITAHGRDCRRCVKVAHAAVLEPSCTLHTQPITVRVGQQPLAINRFCSTVRGEGMPCGPHAADFEPREPTPPKEPA